MTSALVVQASPEDVKPLISYVVLNWRNETITRSCLQTVLGQRGSEPAQIIVVDNESTDASRRALTCDEWQLVCHRENKGFAGGMNAGAAVARGEFIALLNNDARLPEDWSQHALEAMRDTRVAVVGGRDEHTSVPRVHPDGFPMLTSLEVPTMKVPVVDGGHLLVRRSAWTDVGGFDEDLFAYYDELDLCARMLARGWEIVYEPRLHIFHARGSSSDRVRWRRLFWARRNRTIWLAKHFPAGDWREAVFGALLEYAADAFSFERSGQSPGDEFTRRSVGLVSCLWVIVHGRWLADKRRAAIAAGLHSETYRAFLAETYETMLAYEPRTGPTDQ